MGRGVGGTRFADDAREAKNGCSDIKRAGCLMTLYGRLLSSPAVAAAHGAAGQTATGTRISFPVISLSTLNDCNEGFQPPLPHHVHHHHHHHHHPSFTPCVYTAMGHGESCRVCTCIRGFVWLVELLSIFSVDI